MDALQQQLAALSSEEIAELLRTSGHAGLLNPSAEGRDENPVAPHGATTVSVEERKAQGNELFRSGQYEAAVAAYSDCIDRDGGHDATLFSNRAMANLKLGRFSMVVDDCTRALAIATSIKAYMRRATAFVELRDFASALADLEKALEIEETNKECLKAVGRIVQETSGSEVASERGTHFRAVLLAAFRKGWRSVPVKGNPAPPALNGHSLFLSADSAQVYLYGGRSIRDQPGSIYAMDLGDYSWEHVSVSGLAPEPRAWHTIVRVSQSLLAVYGGISSRGDDAAVHILREWTDEHKRRFEWLSPSHESTATVPVARSGHAAVGLPGEAMTMVMFGGRTKHGVSDELWYLTIKGMPDGLSTSWKRTEKGLQGNWPSPRDGHTLVFRPRTQTRGPELVLLGGNGQLTEEKYDDLWVYDLDNASWTLLHPTGDVPSARSYHTAHAIGERFMMVIGGRLQDAEDSAVFVLDFDLLIWCRVRVPHSAQLPPRAWHSSILKSDPDEIYLLGGGTFHGPSRDAAVLGLAQIRHLIAGE